MTEYDKGRGEGEGETAAYQSTSRNTSVNDTTQDHNNSSGNIVNDSIESIPGDQHKKFYEQYLYSLLPAIYQQYDTKENNILREFLKIIASQAVTIRRDIDGLLNNLFINSCEDWVIPYIADLIAARVLPNSSLNGSSSSSSRLDVQNTIRWRKLKGTLIGLEEVVRNNINSDARVKEAFKYCSTSANVSFLRNIANISTRKINGSSGSFVNLHDQDTLNDLETENDSIPHLIDVREPTYANGWYNVKNLLLFLPQLNVYHINQVETQRTDDGGGSEYYFSSLSSKASSSSSSNQQSSASSTFSSQSSPSVTSGNNSSSSNSNNYPLYDLDTSLAIKSTSFARDPLRYFGHRRGMAIRINNILAACPDPSDFTPIESRENRDVTIGSSSSSSSSSSSPASTKKSDNYDNSDAHRVPDFIGLHREEGIRILELRKFSGSDRQFIIRLYSYPGDKLDPIEIANYDTSKFFSQPYRYVFSPRTKARKTIPFGKILVSVEPAPKSSFVTTFPETVIAIRDSQPSLYVREDSAEQDSRISKYQNALYVYLPDITLNRGERKYLFVDSDGSTYYEEIKPVNEEYENNRVKGKLARRACGQIFPPRQLTHSSDPLKNFVELNRLEGIKAVNANKYKKGLSSLSFQIEGIAVDKIRNQAWKVGMLEITSDGPPFNYNNEKEVWIRWTIQTSANYGYRKPDKYKSDNSPNESIVCHFKAIRLVLKNNNLSHLARQEVTAYEEITYEEMIRDIMPSEILSESAFGNEIGTYHISKPVYSNKNTCEVVDVTINVNYSYQVQQIFQKIRKTIEQKPELHNVGELVLRISARSSPKSGKGKNISSVFPLSEIILTNSFGESMLVYLPQMKFNANESKYYYLYVASDGSTSFDQDFSVPARESAGQVIPLIGRYPLQQRTPIYINLQEELGRGAERGDDWQSSYTSAVLPGELAIDPEHGRFAFSSQDDATEDNKAGEAMRVTADYNYAFSHDVGAGAYDRRVDLKKATKWVSKFGHVPCNDALPSKTFQTIVDALASAEDSDVIQIEDSCIYEEDASDSIVTLDAKIRDLTLQAANQMMPAIKVTDRAFGIVFSDQTKHNHGKFPLSRQTMFTLNGILITGGPLALGGNLNKLVLVSCTIDPRYKGEGAFGIEIKSPSSYSPPPLPPTGDAYSKSVKEKAFAERELFFIRSITGGTVFDESVARISLKDSIIDNLGGSAISVKRISKEEVATLKLEADSSNILGALSQSSSESQGQYNVLELKDICCSNVIFANRTNKESVMQSDDQTNDDDDDGSDYNNPNDLQSNNISSTRCGSITNCRYEKGSFKVVGKDNGTMDFAFRCTSETPIFISTTFGHPAYLHLDHLTSKSILEGAENSLEMGAFNKNDKPLRMRNLKIRLQEFVPLGMKSGLVYLY